MAVAPSWTRTRRRSRRAARWRAGPALIVVLAAPGGSAARSCAASSPGSRARGSFSATGSSALLEEEFFAPRPGHAAPARSPRPAAAGRGDLAGPRRPARVGARDRQGGGRGAAAGIGALLGHARSSAVRPLARQRLGGEVRGPHAADGGAVRRGCRGAAGRAGSAGKGRSRSRPPRRGRHRRCACSARGASPRAAEVALAPVERDVRAALGEDCYGRDAEHARSGGRPRLLLERGLTVSVAESCTGGLLGHRLTGPRGASRFFERGVIVYSNRAKEELLGVPEALLRPTAPSARPVAAAMAHGRSAGSSGTSCGLAVTGIAGPDGGTPTKPVGTVFVARGRRRRRWRDSEARRHRFSGGRDAVRCAGRPGRARPAAAGARPPAERRAVTRAFVALLLDEAMRASVGAEIERLRPLSRAVAWVPAANLHLTLKFLGERSDAQLGRGRGGARRGGGGHGALRARAARPRRLPGPRAAAHPLGGHRGGRPGHARRRPASRPRSSSRGIPRERKAWHPHLTIGRVFDERGWRRDAGLPLRQAIAAAARRSFGDPPRVPPRADAERSVAAGRPIPRARVGRADVGVVSRLAGTGPRRASLSRSVSIPGH